MSKPFRPENQPDPEQSKMLDELKSFVKQLLNLYTELGFTEDSEERYRQLPVDIRNLDQSIAVLYDLALEDVNAGRLSVASLEISRLKRLFEQLKTRFRPYGSNITQQ